LFFTTIFLLLSLPHSVSANQSNHTGFLQCLSLRLNDSNIVSKVIHTPNDSSFSSVLSLTIQNLIFSSPGERWAKNSSGPFAEAVARASASCFRGRPFG
ncbi:unnamed protein product, partial [Brassica oleracea var. botrytis]